MKMTKKKMTEVLEYASTLRANGESEAIQGMKDTIAILFNDDNATTLFGRLTEMQDIAEKIDLEPVEDTVYIDYCEEEDLSELPTEQ